MPGRDAIDLFGKQNAVQLGMRRLSSNAGFIYDVEKVITGALEAAGNWKDEQGRHVLQVCGDGFKATRRMSLVNVSVRAFSGQDWYDSYSSLRKM